MALASWMKRIMLTGDSVSSDMCRLAVAIGSLSKPVGEIEWQDDPYGEGHPSKGIGVKTSVSMLSSLTGFSERRTKMLLYNLHEDFLIHRPAFEWPSHLDAAIDRGECDEFDDGEVTNPVTQMTAWMSLEGNEEFAFTLSLPDMHPWVHQGSSQGPWFRRWSEEARVALPPKAKKAVLLLAIGGFESRMDIQDEPFEEDGIVFDSANHFIAATPSEFCHSTRVAQTITPWVCMDVFDALEALGFFEVVEGGFYFRRPLDGLVELPPTL